ncbi:FecCD family ABC transporter permease, partial [Peribacillus acanthi]|uniref:FecCD family ABC transporter permease n=1 Tax=Peribacillus acanthi TaxID=2171554 RepID=UPI001F0CA1A2
MPQPSIQTFSKNKQKWAYPISMAFLLMAMGLGIGVGTFSISIKDILSIMGAAWFSMPIPDHVSPSMVNIVMDIRLPRVILAGLVGAALAISGAAFQGLLQNPLADPYTLGISSGASLGAVCVLFFGIQIPFLGMLTLPAVSILFGLITILLVLIFARMIEKSMKIETIILTGIIVSSFLGSFISLMIALTGEELRHIIQWLLGSVSMRGWEFVGIIAPFFIVGCLLMLFNTKELNALSFG